MATSDGGFAPDAAQEPDVLYCANHPTVPTYLRCGRCGKPVCAKCRVSTPVGHRCLECANISVLPTYAVPTTSYVRAATFGFVVATIVGALWGLLPGYEFWAALVMGIAVGESVSAAVNMKRGPGLMYVGLAAVAYGIVISRVVLTFALERFPDLIINIPGNVNQLVVRMFREQVDFMGSWQIVDLTSLLFLLMAFVLVFVRLR